MRKILIALLLLCSTAAFAEKKYVYAEASSLPVYGKLVEDTADPYSRLPLSLKPDVREAVWNLGLCSSGLYVRFRSDAGEFNFRWSALMQKEYTNMTGICIRGLALYVLDGGKWVYLSTQRPGTKGNSWESTTRASELVGKTREYMLYLGLYDEITGLQIGVPEGRMLEAGAMNSPRADKPIIAYGTSILQGASASHPGMCSTAQLSRRTDRQVINLGFSGNCKLEAPLAEFMASYPDPGMYLIDNWNGKADVGEKGLENCIRILLNAHPDTPVIVVDRARKPIARFDRKGEYEFTSKSEVAAVVVDKLRREGHGNVFHVVPEVRDEENGASSDGTHFTDGAFTAWVDAVDPVVKANLPSPDAYRGLDCTYRFDSPALSPAPEGYTPFYVSHYGRHGSRYAYNEKFYTQPYTLFKTAAEQGNLTPEGRSIAERLFGAYPVLMEKQGLLSDKGRSQQALLAKRMYAHFPEAFGKGAGVYAVSSASMRAVMSMAAFGASLQACDPSLPVKMEQSPSQLYCTMPRDKANFRNVARQPEKPFPAKLRVNPFIYLVRTVDCDAIMDRWFVDRDKAYASATGPKFAMRQEGFQFDPLSKKELKDVDKGVLMWRLWVFASGMASIDENLSFDDIFTMDEWKALCEADCFASYQEHVNYLDDCCQVVEDIVSDCRSHAESGESGAKLRFGHDHVLWPVAALLGIDGFGIVPDSPAQAVSTYPTGRVTMAANLQVVLYRNAQADVLVKVLYNEKEIVLPGFGSVYCPLEEFCSYVENRVSRYPLI